MYQYFFEGDTVRLAYWRIDYDDNKTMYANTDEAKLEIVASLTEQGFKPTVTTIDQTGNEWIDGKCFTDHDAVDAALTAGEKNFICRGDDEDIANTLTIMNDAHFTVDENGVWQIAAPGTPSLPCYSVMTCITANSVDNQMISINGAAAIPLLKDSSSPIMKNDIVATPSNKLPLQINVTNTAAYVNLSVNDGWAIGEVKSFAFRRSDDASKLLCDGNPYDAERYPMLYSMLGYRHGITPDGILRSAPNPTATCIAANNGRTVIGTSSGIYSSEDCITWTKRNSDNIYDITYANGKFVASTETGLRISTDGISWFEKGDTNYGNKIVYSPFNNEWIIYYKYTSTDRSHTVYYSTDNLETILAASALYRIGNIMPVSNGWVCSYGSYNSNDTCYLNRVPSAKDIKTGEGTTVSGVTSYTLDGMSNWFVIDGNTYCFYDDDFYRFEEDTLIAQDNPPISYYRHTTVPVLYDKNLAIIFSIEDCVICSIDSATHNAVWGAPVSIPSSMDRLDRAAYDVIAQRIVYTPGSSIYTLDTSNPALPSLCVDDNSNAEFKYIKAE